jgi:hypothetical protein
MLYSFHNMQALHWPLALFLNKLLFKQMSSFAYQIFMALQGRNNQILGTRGLNTLRTLQVGSDNPSPEPPRQTPPKLSTRWTTQL